MTPREIERARLLLCRLQDHIRDHLLGSRRLQAAKFARVVAVTSADTIYHVDRLGEHAILDWFARHWPKAWPVELVMEGLEDGASVTFPRGTPAERTRFRCLIDPIDGTRGFMYDKRSAWTLAALAPQKGSRTGLKDIFVAAMTEIPMARQWRSDQFSASQGGGVQARSCNVLTGGWQALKVAPSLAHDCRGGFAAFSRFFPEGKALLAQVEEKLWQELYGNNSASGPLIFDDQYISTGGQIHELMAGHDRFLADLRPLAFRKLGLNSALVCHPYDICVALLAQEAGCVIESPAGKQLNVPLDTTTPVAWVGYANPTLARHIRPVLQRLIKRML